MKIKIKLLEFVIFAVIIGFFVTACDKSGTNVLPPKVRSYDEQISFIFNLSNKFSVNQMGTVTYYGDSYDMYKITYNQSAASSRRYLVICGTHGNEDGNVYAVKDFMLKLDSVDNMLFPDVTVDFVYIFNPYGFEHDITDNGDGINLNRDFYAFQSDEVNILVNNVKNTKYTGMFDLHEHSSSDGFFLEYYEKENRQIVSQILEMMKENNFALDNEYVDVVLRSDNGAVFVNPYAKWMYENVLKEASTGVYFDKVAKEVFIFEMPHKADIEIRKQMVNALLNFLFQNNFS